MDWAGRNAPSVSALVGMCVNRERFDAFLPARLPPVPPLEIDGETWRLLSDADRALGRLDAVTQTLPDTNLFLLMYIRKEAVLSSQIEGTQASLEDYHPL